MSAPLVADRLRLLRKSARTTREARLGERIDARAFSPERARSS